MSLDILSVILHFFLETFGQIIVNFGMPVFIFRVLWELVINKI